MARRNLTTRVDEKKIDEKKADDEDVDEEKADDDKVDAKKADDENADKEKKGLPERRMPQPSRDSPRLVRRAKPLMPLPPIEEPREAGVEHDTRKMWMKIKLSLTSCHA